MAHSRSTRQKQILESVSKDFKEFFSAQQLLDLAKKADSSVSRATVYRFLKDQVSANLLFSYHCGKQKVYSVQKRSHCHFICERTGKVIHFDIDSIKFLQDQIPGTIKSFQIEVHGEMH